MLFLGGLAFGDIVGAFCNCVSVACLAKIDAKLCVTQPFMIEWTHQGARPEAYLIVSEQCHVSIHIMRLSTTSCQKLASHVAGTFSRTAELNRQLLCCTHVLLFI